MAQTLWILMCVEFIHVNTRSWLNWDETGHLIHGLQTLPKHIMAYPRSAAPVHLCGDKTRVFDIKPWRELTYSQDKYPPIHQNNKMSTNAGATPFYFGGGGVTIIFEFLFRWRAFNSVYTLWQYNFYFLIISSPTCNLSNQRALIHGTELQLCLAEVSHQGEGRRVGWVGVWRGWRKCCISPTNMLHAQLRVFQMCPFRKQTIQCCHQLRNRAYRQASRLRCGGIFWMKAGRRKWSQQKWKKKKKTEANAES